MKNLNLDFIRSKFPALETDWIYFDNAGGSQVAKHVGDNITNYLYSTNVQLGASYSISRQAEKRVVNSQKRWAEAINAEFPEEVILGSSATALLQNLSRSLTNTLTAGDEIIVTNCDHESNIGPWINLQKYGIKINVWQINPSNYRLEVADLLKLMTSKTRLVCFTQASNIMGTINPVKEITQIIHEKGAMVCVDGVAYAPHRYIDVKEWDIDFYVFSLYKVFGPHYSLLYGKKYLLDKLPGINHYFIENDDIPYKLQPGNVNYELTYGCEGILDYFDEVYYNHFTEINLNQNERCRKVSELIRNHEENLAKPLMDFLLSKTNITIIGEDTANRDIRVPTISFIVKDRKSSEIPTLVDDHKIGIRWGDFYARRLIDDLGLSSNDGVIRISMVHYNTLEEVNKLVDVLNRIL